MPLHLDARACHGLLCGIDDAPTDRHAACQDQVATKRLTRCLDLYAVGRRHVVEARDARVGQGGFQARVEASVVGRQDDALADRQHLESVRAIRVGHGERRLEEAVEAEHLDAGTCDGLTAFLPRHVALERGAATQLDVQSQTFVAGHHQGRLLGASRRAGGWHEPVSSS